MREKTSLRVCFKTVALVIALLMTITSCSFYNVDEEINQDLIELIQNPDRSLFEGESITIATRYPWFINPIVVAYMNMNPEINVHVTHHSTVEADGPLEQIRMEMAAQLMGGSAPTLINSFLVDIFDPRQAIYFYDWQNLMNADPVFDKAEWFMNVFNAFSVDSHLYVFPLNVTYLPVVVNRTVPGLLEAVSEYSSGITLSSLLQIYDYFSEYYSFLLESTFSSAWIMHFSSERFIDIEIDHVDFSEEFIDFIIYADNITSPDFDDVFRDIHFLMGNVTLSTINEQNLGRRYFFQLDSNQNFWYFLDFYGDIHGFAGMIPLVNEHDELFVSALDGFLLNANATPVEKAIAWDFLMFAMQPENFPDHVHSNWYLQPPNRNLFYHLIRKSLYESFGGNARGDYLYPWFSGTVEDAVDGVIAKMSQFAEMPMRSTSSHSRVIDRIIDDNICLFHDGLLSAQQAADLIQNQVTLVLMEMAR